MKGFKIAVLIGIFCPAQAMSLGTEWTITGPDSAPIRLCVMDGDGGAEGRVERSFMAGSVSQLGYVQSRGAFGDFIDVYIKPFATPVVERGEVGWEVFGEAGPDLNGKALVMRHDLRPSIGGRYRPVSESDSITISAGRAGSPEGDISIVGTRISQCSTSPSQTGLGALSATASLSGT